MLWGHHHHAMGPPRVPLPQCPHDPLRSPHVPPRHVTPTCPSIPPPPPPAVLTEPSRRYQPPPGALPGAVPLPLRFPAVTIFTMPRCTARGGAEPPCPGFVTEAITGAGGRTGPERGRDGGAGRSGGREKGAWSPPRSRPPALPPANGRAGTRLAPPLLAGLGDVAASPAPSGRRPAHSGRAGLPGHAAPGTRRQSGARLPRGQERGRRRGRGQGGGHAPFL